MSADQIKLLAKVVDAAVSADIANQGLCKLAFEIRNNRIGVNDAAADFEEILRNLRAATPCDALDGKHANKQTLAKHQPCGCVVCTCEDDVSCHGCGASHCGTHPIGEIPNPVYDDGKESA